MERSNFGAARSVFGSTVKKSPFVKRPGNKPSSTTTTSPSSSSSSSRTTNTRLSGRHNGTITNTSHGPLSSKSNRTLSSASSFADEDDDSAPPSKRTGTRPAPANGAKKSPARPVRKLNITGAKPKEAAYRMKDDFDDGREQTIPKTPKPIYRIRAEVETVAHTTPQTPTPTTPTIQTTQRRAFTSSRSWRPTRPKEGGGDEVENTVPTTPVSRQSSWRKKLVSPHQRKLSTEQEEEKVQKGTPSYPRNNTQKYSSPQRRFSDEDENDSRVRSPGFSPSKWQKSLEEQGKKIPSYLQNSPKTKNSSSSVSPQHQAHSSQWASSPCKSPLKSPRRRIVFPPMIAGTNPLSPVRDTPSTTIRSPVSYRNRTTQQCHSPVGSTLKLSLAPELDASPPVSPRQVAVATSSLHISETIGRTAMHKSAPVQFTATEQQAAVRVQTCWRRHREQAKFLILVKHERKMNKLKKKLANVEREKQRELDKIKHIVRDYKESARTKAQKKKAAMAEKSVKAAEIEKQTSELKKENAQIQAKNEMLRKNTRNLRINNLRLEKSAESSKDYYEQLKLHHDRCVEDNQKLSKVDENYKTKVNELKENLATRTRYADAEHTIRGLYRQAIRDVVLMAEETNDESLILKVYEIQEEIEHLEETWADPDPISFTTAERKKRLKLLRKKWGNTLKSPRGKRKGRLASTYMFHMDCGTVGLVARTHPYYFATHRIRRDTGNGITLQSEKITDRYGLVGF